MGVYYQFKSKSPPQRMGQLARIWDQVRSELLDPSVYRPVLSATKAITVTLKD